MTTRRNFLRGAIGAAAATSLVVMAKPDEIAAFALQPGAPVSLKPAANQDRNGWPSFAAPLDPLAVHAGMYLYNESGVPVAYVTEVTYSHPFTTLESLSGERVHLRLTPEFELRAQVITPCNKTLDVDCGRRFNRGNQL